MDLPCAVLEASLETNIAPLVHEATAFEQRCRQDGPVRADLTPGKLEAYRGHRSRLVSATPTFHQKYETISAGLGYLEEIYRREKVAQASLLKTGQRLE
jgi:hypothetical protein